MTKDLVSIIIVNFNGGEVLRQCLESLNKLNYFRWELVFVDNGSTDGSDNIASNLKFKIKNLKLIKNKSNIGFAPANNQGWEVARGKYLLFLNNDTKVKADLLEKLVAQMEKDKSLGVIQPKIRLMDKPDYLDNAGSFLTQTGFLEHWGFMEKDSEEFNRPREVFTVKGACMLVRRAVIEKVGLFDPKFISYFEETDFCWRVWLAGYKVVYMPVTEIYHKVGFTSNRLSPLDVNYNSFKNRIASLFKNLSLVNLVFIGGCHLLIILALELYYLLRLQFRKTWMIKKSILWNILFLPDLIKERERIQKFRRVSDKEIFDRVLVPFNFAKMLSHFAKVEANYKNEK